MATKRAARSKAPKDIARSYNEVKTFHGQQYTGMKIGRTHKWYYDKGEWKEKKITPDLWHFTYAVTKRRAGRAPEGSGVPTGTEYDWYIAAHQNVCKLTANDYTTSMTGLKFKVAHKRADSDKWSSGDAARKRRLVKFLREIIDSIESGGEEGDLAPQQPGESPKRTTRARPVRKLPTRRKRLARA